MKRNEFMPFWILLKPCLAILGCCLLGRFAHAENPDWMSRLADESPIVSLNIPGTHNSAALHEPFPKTAKCQSMTIDEQLAAGVRFFDIRCCHQNDQFAIYHGPISQRLTFDHVLDSMEAFLIAHPRETLLLSIKEEYRSRNTTRSFAQTLQSVIGRRDGSWYTKPTLPELGSVRGKMVLIRRFSSPQPWGISATNWGHDGFHKSDQLFVQDRFSVPDAETKWKAVSRALQHSCQEASSNRLQLHFTSGYTQNRLGVPDITAVSGPVNQRLKNYLKAADVERYGCIVMDFITPDLAATIYRMNFLAQE